MAGGARACAFEPTRTAGIGSVASSHETSWYWRCRIAKTSGGGSSTTAPAKLAAQNAQQFAWVLAGTVCMSSGEDTIPEQIAAIERGSETALATARNAAIGAITCTKIASSTIGIRISSRRRMIFSRTPRSTYLRICTRVEIGRPRLLGTGMIRAGPWRIGHTKRSYSACTRSMRNLRKICGSQSRRS
jgi:hypothetical protein